jgi:O-antigen ligase
MAQLSTRTVSYRAPRLAPGSAEVVALCGMALIAAALGWLVVRFDGLAPNPATAAVLTAGGLGCYVVILAGPVACLAAIAGLTAGGLDPTIAHLGGFDVTLADVFYCGLVGWWLMGLVRQAEPSSAPKSRRISFGQGAAILFLTYVGLTLGKVAASDPGAFSNAFISWLRIVQTASIAWLAASLIQTGRALRLLLAAVAAGGLVAIVVAAAGGGSLLTERFEGTLTPDELGLVSGLTFLIAVFGRVTPDTRYRIGLALAALLGLLLAKSVAAFVATGFAFAFGAALSGLPSSASAAQRVTRAALIVALAGVVVFAVVRLVRPNETPASQNFKQSSGYNRIVLGAAGLDIFAHNPVIGVGWRESGSPKVIQARSLNLQLRRRFPDAAPVFYPDVTPTSVHNTYVQLLADLGIVGFALFVAMVAAVGGRVRQVLRRVHGNPELWPRVLVMSLSLVLVLVWLNDNPLFGRQPETVIPAIFVGALAATSRMVPPSADR